MPKTVYDAAYPSVHHPPADVALIYVGGDTPHVWTDLEISGQPERWRLPCWVRSNPAGANAALDAHALIGWMVQRSVPKGVATVLDLETAVNPSYVNEFGGTLHAAGWKVLPYGSQSTLNQNPALDGRFDAHWGQRLGTVDAGDVATQDVSTPAYDLSTILDSVPLWDTATPPPAPIPGPLGPVPVPSGSMGDTAMVGVQFPQLPAGSGYWDCDGAAVDPATQQPGPGYPRPLISWERFRAVTLNGNDNVPPRMVSISANNHGGFVRLAITGLPAYAAPLLWVVVAGS